MTKKRVLEWVLSIKAVVGRIIVKDKKRSRSQANDEWTSVYQV